MKWKSPHFPQGENFTLLIALGHFSDQKLKDISSKKKFEIISRSYFDIGLLRR